MADDFQARSPDELSLIRGDRIELIEKDDDFGDGWFLGKHLNDDRNGLFPEGQLDCLSACVTLADHFVFSSIYQDPTSDGNCSHSSS